MAEGSSFWRKVGYILAGIAAFLTSLQLLFGDDAPRYPFVGQASVGFKDYSQWSDEDDTEINSTLRVPRRS